jgi:hypothetical protein
MAKRTPIEQAATVQDRRDLFLYWWPVTARIAGVLLAMHQALLESVERPSILAFAGALIVAPNIFDQQAKRNNRRREGEE